MKPPMYFSVLHYHGMCCSSYWSKRQYKV